MLLPFTLCLVICCLTINELSCSGLKLRNIVLLSGIGGQYRMGSRDRFTDSGCYPNASTHLLQTACMLEAG
jgi:hypothetical protein